MPARACGQGACGSHPRVAGRPVLWHAQQRFRLRLLRFCRLKLSRFVECVLTVVRSDAIRIGVVGGIGGVSGVGGIGGIGGVGGGLWCVLQSTRHIIQSGTGGILSLGHSLWRSKRVLR